LGGVQMDFKATGKKRRVASLEFRIAARIEN
jgi:hypothetical protein